MSAAVAGTTFCPLRSLHHAMGRDLLHATRTPPRTWSWASYLVATHHPGISARQLQRQLGLSRYETAWLIRQKLRRAMVAPERELLKSEVEIDEFWLGGYEEGLKGSRQHGKKALVGVAIEVRGAGSGRLRLAVLGNSRATTLEAFTETSTAPGSLRQAEGRGHGWRRRGRRGGSRGEPGARRP